MLQLYSKNITAAADTPISFSNTVLAKGCTAVFAAPATINLNKRGVYMVTCNASGTPTGTGTDVSLQLYKNGTALDQAVGTAAGADEVSVGFSTLVTVSEDNNCSCFSAPTTLTLMNVGAETAFSTVNLCITKIC